MANYIDSITISDQTYDISPKSIYVDKTTSTTSGDFFPVLSPAMSAAGDTVSNNICDTIKVTPATGLLTVSSLSVTGSANLTDGLIIRRLDDTKIAETISFTSRKINMLTDYLLISFGSFENNISGVTISNLPIIINRNNSHIQLTPRGILCSEDTQYDFNINMPLNIFPITLAYVTLLEPAVGQVETASTLSNSLSILTYGDSLSISSNSKVPILKAFYDYVLGDDSIFFTEIPTLFRLTESIRYAGSPLLTSTNNYCFKFIGYNSRASNNLYSIYYHTNVYTDNGLSNFQNIFLGVNVRLGDYISAAVDVKIYKQ